MTFRLLPVFLGLVLVHAAFAGITSSGQPDEAGCEGGLTRLEDVVRERLAEE